MKIMAEIIIVRNAMQQEVITIRAVHMREPEVRGDIHPAGEAECQHLEHFYVLLEDL